jgi:signal transduction histidine kinase
MLIVATLVLVPSTAASLLAWRAARDTNFWERSFWRLLAAASAAQGLAGALSVLGGSPASGLAPGIACAAAVVLSVVALLVRPDRPRDAEERRAATLEWLMAVVAGSFLVFFFGVAPLADRRSWWEAVPALVALALAFRVRQPFGRIYALLALGFGTSAVLSLWPLWRDFAWALPPLGVIAAAQLSRQQDWVRPARQATPRRSNWLAGVAVMLPPLVHLGTRAAGRGDEVDARSLLTLGSTLLLMVLSAMRIHPRLIVLPAAEARAGDEPVSAADSLEFASRVAHELNNPLMAVGGLAELALKKGAPEAPLRRLIDETSAAAEIVTRLHQITGRSKGVAG